MVEISLNKTAKLRRHLDTYSVVLPYSLCEMAGITENYREFVVRFLDYCPDTGVARIEFTKTTRPMPKGAVKDWKKLVPIRNTGTRLVSIPSSVLRQAGVDPYQPLEGRWEVENGSLVLRVRRKDEGAGEQGGGLQDQGA
jgi:hypothetical protein